MPYLKKYLRTYYELELIFSLSRFSFRQFLLFACLLGKLVSGPDLGGLSWLVKLGDSLEFLVDLVFLAGMLSGGSLDYGSLVNLSIGDY